jgi:hypothetical protein
MRKVSLTLTLLAAMAAMYAGVVVSAEQEMGMDLMQNIEDANKSLASNIALASKKGAGDDARELARMFQEVETFFEHKGDAGNAVDLARQSRELSTEIVQLVSNGKFDTATDKATTLSRTCRTCHTFYKKE